MESFHNLEREIEETIREIGQRLNYNAFNLGEVELKSSNDPVTELDLSTERELIRRISELGCFEIIAEESGHSKKSNARYIAHIDPIDGTKSFAFRSFESSIGVGFEDKENRGKTVFGVVYDFMRDIMYVGSQETGLTQYHRARKIPFLSREELTPKPRVLVQASVQEKRKLMTELYERGYSPYENTGSFLLNMAQCAFGAFDAFISLPKERMKGKSWDAAAASIMLEERVKRDSNFMFTTYNGSGEKFDINHPETGFIAGTPEFRIDMIHRECC